MIAFDDEKDHIQSFEQKLQVIRDRIAGVAHKYHTGCYLVGRPGTSKTHTVQTTLESEDFPWGYRNARMTPMGLFNFLADHPEHLIVLDDINSLFKNDQALQILLAALGGDPHLPRMLTYKSKDTEERVLFTGGIIAISNVPLRCDPLARALGSRVVQYDHEPTDEEMAAFIRQLASNGSNGLTHEECLHVSNFQISETRESDIRLDLRHYQKAICDYRQHKDGNAKTPWRDLVRTSLMKLATEAVVPMSKSEEIEQQRQKVRDALQKFPSDRKAQMESAGLKSSTFYTRLKELQSA